MSDNSEYAPVYVPTEKQNTITNSLIKGSGNFVDPSVQNSIITGDSNCIGELCSNISILNSSGCVVYPNVVGCTIINSSGVIVTNSNELYINNTQLKSSGYKLYIANVSQSGANAPTATVLENTFGQDLNFTRNSSGNYSLGFTNIFPSANKFYGQIGKNNTYNLLYYSSANSATITTDGDSILSNTTIEIRQYN